MFKNQQKWLKKKREIFQNEQISQISSIFWLFLAANDETRGWGPYGDLLVTWGYWGEGGWEAKTLKNHPKWLKIEEKSLKNKNTSKISSIFG